MPASTPVWQRHINLARSCDHDSSAAGVLAAAVKHAKIGPTQRGCGKPQPPSWLRLERPRGQVKQYRYVAQQAETPSTPHLHGRALDPRGVLAVRVHAREQRALAPHEPRGLLAQARGRSLHHVAAEHKALVRAGRAAAEARRVPPLRAQHLRRVSCIALPDEACLQRPDPGGVVTDSVASSGCTSAAPSRAS